MLWFQPGDRCRGTRTSFEFTAPQLEDAPAANVAFLPRFAERRARSRRRR